MKEADIRPAELFDRYLAIVRQDIERFFSDASGFTSVQCPACGDSSSSAAFVKLGFPYRTCEECGTLYQSPRPSAAAIDDYYRRGEAVAFWSSNFYRETAEARRQRIYRPRAERLAQLASEGILKNCGVFADIGAGYGLFLEEVRRTNVFGAVTGVEPAPNMVEEYRRKGFEVLPTFIEDVPRGALHTDCATSFEVIEHVHSPERFLGAIERVLEPGGVLLFTTLTISGFDLLVLWERSKSIYPPHHLNFMSVEGVERLLVRTGYDVIDISTPGQLDVDIVANAAAEDPTIQLPRFVDNLLHSRNGNARAEFQQFLQRNRLSSHLHCLARKRA